MIEMWSMKFKTKITIRIRTKNSVDICMYVGGSIFLAFALNFLMIDFYF